MAQPADYQPPVLIAEEGRFGAGDGNRIHLPATFLRKSASFRKAKIRKSAGSPRSSVTLCHVRLNRVNAVFHCRFRLTVG
jgi:hypothetical protein